MYGTDIFSVRVALSLSVTLPDGNVKEYAYDQALFFNKKDKDRWLCYEMTDKDVSLPRGEVRLTFMDGDELLTTDFYDTDAKDLIVPVLSAPEGMVFAGWMYRGTDENGNATEELVFRPNYEGKVQIPEGTTLVPMVLYAYYQDASEAETQEPQETVTEAPATEATQLPTEAATEAPAEAAADETEDGGTD